VRRHPKEKDEGGAVRLNEGGEKRWWRFGRPKRTRGRGDGGEAQCALLLERGAGKGEQWRWGGALLKGGTTEVGNRPAEAPSSSKGTRGGVTAGWCTCGQRQNRGEADARAQPLCQV
jgi:hypothetical protein